MKDLSPAVSDHLADNEPASLLRTSASDYLVSFVASRLPNPGQPLAEAAAYHFTKTGKMLRAKMALRAASALSVDEAAALHWAVAVEVMHNASLVHDDICDGDQFRRGRPSVYAQYGSNVALALGDWMIALSFELAAEAAQRSHTPILVKILASHMKITTLGEACEFDMQRICSWRDYLQISADKTAPLLTAPLEGVLNMGLHGGMMTSIGAYFRCLGNAYQIANDILNFMGDDGAEAIASDLGRRRPNAVTVLYHEMLDEPLKADFENWYEADCNVNLKAWQSKIIESSAMHFAAQKMLKMLRESEELAAAQPAELVNVIMPVQQMLQQICKKPATALSPHLVVSSYNAK
jgi:geranylgeranyl pyrophosphate synthase